MLATPDILSVHSVIRQATLGTRPHRRLLPPRQRLTCSAAGLLLPSEASMDDTLGDATLGTSSNCTEGSLSIFNSS